MSDLYERVVSQQDALKKLLAKLPGFKGYFIRTVQTRRGSIAAGNHSR